MRSLSRGLTPMISAPIARTTAVNPELPYPSLNSDQPTTPHSVVILRNDSVRQPASQ